MGLASHMNAQSGLKSNGLLVFGQYPALRFATPAQYTQALP